MSVKVRPNLEHQSLNFQACRFTVINFYLCTQPSDNIQADSGKFFKKENLKSTHKMSFSEIIHYDQIAI